MAELKTQKNKASISKFLNSIDNEKRREDSKQLFKIFKEAINETPAMWGDSIVGFGEYHYKSQRSTQEGDWPLTGFSPRKAYLAIYIMPGFKKYESLLKKLGKYKNSVSCLYINKLEDIDTEILKKIIIDSVKVMKKEYNVK